MPTTTVHQGRMPIYAPVRRPRADEIREYKTAWGDVRIKGRLGQAHADLVESLWFCAEHVHEHGGSISFIVDPHKVRMTLSDSKYSYDGVWSLLRDVIAALVDIEIPERKIKAVGHLIDGVIKSEPIAGRGGPGGGQRVLWKIMIGEIGAALLLHDLPLHRKPLSAAGMRHAVSQAVARHVLSHKTEPRGGWRLDGLLDAVGVDTDSMARRNARRRIKQDAEALGDVGVILDGGRVQKP